MNSIIIGAGRIGRGFVAELLTLNHVNITFFDVSKETVEKLNEVKSYEVHVLGHKDLDLQISTYEAYSFSDVAQFAKSWQNADFIFTACGGKNMISVGKTIAQAFSLMNQQGNLKTSNIITCENWIDPANELAQSILDNLTPSEAEAFKMHVGVSESVVMCTGTGAPNPDDVTNVMDTWVQNQRYLPVDKVRLRGIPTDLKYIKYVKDFGNLLTQKIYTNNTSVATVAYLGKLKGFTYVAESANDPEILEILDQVYVEINDALIKGMGIDPQSQLEFSKAAKAKYTDREIVDIVTRISRDPIRKLGPEDRFIGPISIALKAGIKPKAIALGAAAALMYDNPEDNDAVLLKQMREEHGIDYILQNVSKIDPNGSVALVIKEALETLKHKGWVK